MQPRITKVHALEMSQTEGNATDSTAPTEENTKYDEEKTRCQRQLTEIFQPILIVMKLTGQYFGATALKDDRVRLSVSISYCFSTVVVLGQWLIALFGMTSLLLIGFSSMNAFLFVLITTTWFIQCAGNTTVCLFVLPLTRKRRTRFTQFLSSFVATSTELNRMKKKAVMGLSLACLAAFINSIVSTLFSLRSNGILSIFPPWNQSTGMYSTLRVMELVIMALDSFAWTLPPLLFCITCMLLEKMFGSLHDEISKGSINSFTISFLRHKHLKLCEMVELANAMFSPLLFVIISLDIPLLCVNFYQLIKRSSEKEIIEILAYVYWCFCISTLLVVIFIFGNRVNEKVHSFYETLQKSPISVEDTKEITELMLFLAHLRGEPIGMSVGGIAVINKSLFLTLFGIIASYFVVLATLPT